MSFEVNATVHSLESPSGLRQLFFWLLGMLAAESSQENPSPGTAFAWSKLPCSSYLMSGHCRSTKTRHPCLKSGHLWRVIPAPELPIGLAEAFNAAASLFDFFCPGLLPSSSCWSCSWEHSPLTNVSVSSREPDLRYVNLLYIHIYIHTYIERERREIHWPHLLVSIWNLGCE